MESADAADSLEYISIGNSCFLRKCQSISVSKSRGRSIRGNKMPVYQVKPGQREQVLVEIKRMLDRRAKEPEFIMAIIHEAPERPNEFVFYELWVRLPSERAPNLLLEMATRWG
jgi:Antibiotic biosynthesis monooxygenase